MGAQIGNLRVVSPTCADDIAILACSKHEAQALLEIALILTDNDLYMFIFLNYADFRQVELLIYKLYTFLINR
jgi:hypothetical protein